jgi:predicted DCC family thiol-disulfide oxidoreductase YuxK
MLSCVLGAADLFIGEAVACGYVLLAPFFIFSSISLSLDLEDGAMKLAARDAYSYRGDLSVPPFDDSGPVAFMDGDCVLCTFGARAIARLDKSAEFRICPIQTPLGQSVLRHFGLDPQDPASWLYLIDGRAYTSLDAMIRAGRRMGGWGHVLVPLSILPGGMQDWLYLRLARNRYRLFGRTEMCAIADPKLKQRLLT